MKVLIIRFSSIGDIVLTTPLVRCLKKQRPDIEIHYLTKPGFTSILNANPYIDKVHTLGASIRETAKIIQKERYHHIIDLHNNQRTLLLKILVGTNATSFNKLNWEKWLLVNFKIDRLPDIHIVDRYLETVVNLGVKNDGVGLDYFIPEGENVHPKELPGSHQQPYVALVIGAQHATKKLPQHKLIKLCQTIPYPIILLGGPGDRLEGEAVAKAAGKHIYNACGLFSLHGSASLVKQAQVVVSHDTGLMHIAAAFKKPVISIWGNTVPKFGMYPYYGDQPAKGSKIMEVKDLPCRPCSKIGHQACPKGHFKCMEDQNIYHIADAVSAVMGSN